MEQNICPENLLFMFYSSLIFLVVEALQRQINTPSLLRSLLCSEAHSLPAFHVRPHSGLISHLSSLVSLSLIVVVCHSFVAQCPCVAELW